MRLRAEIAVQYGSPPGVMGGAEATLKATLRGGDEAMAQSFRAWPPG